VPVVDPWAIVTLVGTDTAVLLDERLTVVAVVAGMFNVTVPEDVDGPMTAVGDSATPETPTTGLIVSVADCGLAPTVPAVMVAVVVD
jgi:hypothetical protein